jgi:septation ring formation regulator EzrA
VNLLTEMVNVTDIDSPKEFAALAMVLVSPIAASVAAAWGTATFAHRKKFGKALGAIADDTGAIREQTENDHDTNMRVDLDEILKGINRIEKQQNQQARDIGGLREEMRTERTERGQADEHIRELIERLPH